MKVKVLLNLGTTLVSELRLAEAYREGCTCDLADDLGAELVKRGVAVKLDDEPATAVKAKGAK